jgi:hypothetical protein
LAGVVQRMLHSFAIMLGIAKPDVIEKRIPITVNGDGLIGDAQYAALNYWTNQSYDNCVLQATSMAVAQATNTAPRSEQEMVDLAKATDSVTQPGAKMYLGENISDGVSGGDAVALMNEHLGVNATLKKYFSVDAAGDEVSTMQDGQEALNDLMAALATGKATMVTYSVAIVWSSAWGYVPDEDTSYWGADHAAVVTEVDLENGFVYVNDSSAGYAGQETGRGMKVGLGAFMSGWQSGNYALTTVEARA